MHQPFAANVQPELLLQRHPLLVDVIWTLVATLDGTAAAARSSHRIGADAEAWTALLKSGSTTRVAAKIQTGRHRRTPTDTDRSGPFRNSRTHLEHIRSTMDKQ
nr:hypothetical protein GCM10020063_057690 [Dactylosporangium thailandense]